VTATLEQLTQEWDNDKEAVRIAQEKLLSTEFKIYELVGKDLPESGTTNFDTGLKIVTGMDVKVDQDRAKFLKDVLGRFWPFREKYELDKKLFDMLEGDEKKAVLEALTYKPKKPSFSVKG
jgi:hypothetical protein